MRLVCALLLAMWLGGCRGADEAGAPELPAGSSVPHLARGPSGGVVLSFLAPGSTGTRLGYVVFRQGRWGEPIWVAEGADWFVNWADFPSVVPLSDSLWAAHWLVRSGDHPYAYDAVVAVSADGGETWSAGVTVHDDGTPTEHGFVSLYAAEHGVGALWLDGRELSSNADGATQLRSAVVRVPDLALVSSEQLDDRVCDCCQTDVAITADGPVAVYRDRSLDETRDIAFSRLRDTGGWESPRPVAVDGWRISGCPVNGPAVSALGESAAVAWYTAHPRRQVKVAFSSDTAAGFSSPIDLDAGPTLGRVDVELIDPRTALVSWLDPTPGSLKFRRVSADGRLGPVREVASMSPQRHAGFPQMLRTDDRVLFAWTDVESDRVRVRLVPLND